jgi:uncharacterized protein YbjT (DUF2867 family)
MSDKPLIVVIGSTGQQGGALIKALQRNNKFRIRGITRKPDSDKAMELASSGVEVVAADLENRESLKKAFTGAHGVYSVQQFWEVGYDREIAQGKLVADLCKELGVKHLVYSSVGGADRDCKNVPHFWTKHLIEEHIRSLKIPYTAFRPVFFMENLNYQKTDIEAGNFPQALSSTDKLQMIAVNDIGVFSAMAFENPKDWLGKEVELAGDERTIAQYAELMGCKHVEFPRDKLPNKEWTEMYEWFHKSGYKADIPALRKIYPQMKDVPAWLAVTGLRAKGK